MDEVTVTEAQVDERIAEIKDRLDEEPTAGPLVFELRGRRQVWQNLKRRIKDARSVEQERLRAAKKMTRDQAMRLARKANPLPYITGSRTSKAAAEIKEVNAPTARVQVLTLLLTRTYGLTDHQIQDILQMNPSTERPRRRELQKMALVYDSRKTRETDSGHEATVWVAYKHYKNQPVLGLEGDRR